MKRLLQYALIAIFAGATLSSCETQKQFTDRKKETKTFAIDFRKYADKGFLFMPDEYYGEYEVKGIIKAELHPKVVYREGVLPENKDLTKKQLKEYEMRVFWSGGRKVTQLQKTHELDDLIEEIYSLSVEWGGDAFTHFNSEIKTGRTDADPNTAYTYYAVSGIVIKRK